MPKEKILVVDDDPGLREFIRPYLEREGFQVSELENGLALLEQLPSLKPDLIILDLMMPQMDGFAVLREMAKYPYVPVLMLTARKENEDKIVSLEMGADDFLAKPFHPRELVARVKAILRRKELMRQKAATDIPPLSFGPLTVDLDKKEARIDGIPMTLTATEFLLLQIFAAHPGKVFSRDELLDRVWGESFAGGLRTVDFHVNNLRRKLAQGNEARVFIQSVRGLGYRFVG